jgi:hypothetical protein
MFYEESQIIKFLNCSKCKQRYDIPKVLPCGMIKIILIMIIKQLNLKILVRITFFFQVIIFKKYLFFFI